MELIFTLTGWSYAKDGKKATEFHHLCKALGVEFDLSKSENGVLGVQNTAQRIEDLVGLIDHILGQGELGKQDCLSLRGKLGVADSFLHGRLGAFLLKQLVSHAYGRSRVVSDDLRVSLDSMKCRLQHGRQRRVDAKNLKVWYVFTDASFEQSTTTGGIGGVLIDEHGHCVSWFGFPLGVDQCKCFGSDLKQTIIYELELAAAVLGKRGSQQSFNMVRTGSNGSKHQ